MRKSVACQSREDRYFWSTNLDVHSLKTAFARDRARIAFAILTSRSFHEQARAEIERVYVYVFFFIPDGKHFSIEQPSLWVCTFVRGYAQTVVQSLDNLPAVPQKKNKKKEKSKRVHRQVARKNGPKRFELRCGGRYAARASELEALTHS